MSSSSYSLSSSNDSSDEHELFSSDASLRFGSQVLVFLFSNFALFFTCFASNLFYFSPELIWPLVLASPTIVEFFPELLQLFVPCEAILASLFLLILLQLLLSSKHFFITLTYPHQKLRRKAFFHFFVYLFFSVFVASTKYQQYQLLYLVLVSVIGSTFAVKFLIRWCR